MESQVSGFVRTKINFYKSTRFCMFRQKKKANKKQTNKNKTKTKTKKPKLFLIGQRTCTKHTVGALMA